MLNITFISDYVCPYCLVAKEALKQALLETGLEAQITWKPFELTKEPRPRVDTYHDEKRKSHYQILIEPCRQLGLDMKLPPAVVPRPYTRLAFEGWFYACGHDAGDVYNELIYRAYFIDEKNIGEIAVLADLAESIGLDRADFTAALENGVYSEAEKAAVAETESIWQPKGVPTIYINDEKIEISEYTKDEMIRILLYHDLAEGDGFFCGPDGCG